PDTGLPTIPPPPPPAQHPDRFSMGATPPAADLVPGRPITPDSAEQTGSSAATTNPRPLDDRPVRPATTSGPGSSGPASPRAAKPTPRDQGNTTPHPTKPGQASSGAAPNSPPQGEN
ncbi:MAG: hypothetical protein WCC14_16265, partial [Acidobacteriaceae bacterium]